MENASDKKNKKKGRVLIVAGSDSGGGAGIQADIKTVTMLGGYAATAVTALTAQNTKDVYAVHAAPPAFIAKQITVVLDDIGADAVKTGMLGDLAAAKAATEALQTSAADIPWVVDPVMVSKSGAPLMAPEAVDYVKAELIRYAAVLTPNIPEAEVLTGMTIKSQDDMAHAADMLLTLGPKAVLLKGGHLPGDNIVDILVTEDQDFGYPATRIDSRHTHGTGCTLASAVAAGLAQGRDVKSAVERARRYVLEAIRTAPGFGEGAGPMNHGHLIDAKG